MSKISLITFLIFQNLFFMINTSSILQPSEAIDEINKPIIISEKTMNGIKKLFKEAYAYNELLNNPPQPPFSNDYFTKVNIIEELSNLDIHGYKNKYDFYREFKKVFGKLKDPSIDMEFNDDFKNLDYYEIAFPVEFYVLKNENGTKLYCRKSGKNGLFYNLNFEGNIGPIIDENKNQPIRSINELNPFEYIESLGNEFNSLKNPHSNFAYKLSIINSDDKRPTLRNLPLSIDQLNDFTVLYENNNFFKTNFLIIRTMSVQSLIISKNHNNNDVYNIYDSFFIKRFWKEEKVDYSPSYIQKNNILLADSTEYNFNYINKFFCKVDSSKEVNIYYIRSLSADIELEENKYMETIKKCVELFDGNNYPIIVINRFNGGENLFLSHCLLELISPLTTTYYYGAYRKTSSLSNLKDSYINKDSSIKDCSYINKDYLKSNSKTIDYGNEIKDTLTQPFIIKGNYTRKIINEIKSTLKNMRKPTEILVYTDGYSFSAAGAFMKYLQYNGGAITAGYYSNPLNNDTIFDSGSNPSIIFTAETLKDMVSDYGNNAYNDIKIKMPVGQLFYNTKLTKSPIEFDVTGVDEIVDLYEVDEDNIDNFIDKGKEIFEKYKNKCNPNNENIVLVSKDCDGKFDNKYTHGGFKCGENKEWSTICKASYCDIGYILDEQKNKCIVDICPKFDGKKDKKNVALIVFLVIFSIIICVIIILLIIRLIGRHSEKYKNSALLNKMDLNQL